MPDVNRPSEEVEGETEYVLSQADVAELENYILERGNVFTGDPDFLATYDVTDDGEINFADVAELEARVLSNFSYTNSVLKEEVGYNRLGQVIHNKETIIDLT
ncbi:MAG: hypothetical protein ISS33_06055, partial [Candidatus Omnitrophica bacterium]|nr:hypothetical protein [Candidatus Omnitrophota bacterium]